MARKILIAGNWKMNNTIDQSVELAQDLRKYDFAEEKIEVVVAPPYISIKPVCDALAGSHTRVAAQNVYWEESGAYTGEVSPAMVLDAGCGWVIVGHSERRQYFGETDGTVNKRLKAALSAGLRVIVCVGETLDQREAGETFNILDTQVQGAVSGLNDADFKNVVIAYEPVWAIGTGETATAEQADEAHAHIRNKIESVFDGDTANNTRILYGGSVKPANAMELLGKGNVDGALVGGASLKSADFCAIIEAGAKVSGDC